MATRSSLLARVRLGSVGMAENACTSRDEERRWARVREGGRAGEREAGWEDGGSRSIGG